MKFDRIAVLDWSAAGTPKRGKDSIWLGITDLEGTRSINIPTRAEAENAVFSLMDRSTLIGIDFSFVPPRGLITKITGADSPSTFWRWLAQRVFNGPKNTTNYRDVAAEINRHFECDGPFWGNGLKKNIPDLPRKKPVLPSGFTDFRTTEILVKSNGYSPKPIWQLAGAGAVGAQSLTGMPFLHRLQQRGAAIWPFDPIKPVTVVEVYPALIATLVANAQGITDDVQVRLLSQALWNLNSDKNIDSLLQDGDPIEGTILGAGHISQLLEALEPLRIEYD